MAVRRERVVLELEDRFTTGMARAAASAALLNKELDSLSRDSIRTKRSFSDIDSGAVQLGRSAERSGNQIDRLSGRMRILADVAAVLGPSLIPVGAVGVPAIAGLAAQFGFAAAGAGVAVLAFQGVGDALTKMNKAALIPTATNLDAAQAALENLSPAAQAFVGQISDMMPALRDLRNEAAGGLFPGATEGLQALETALPKVQNVVSAIATELGSIAADTGAALASDRWTTFLDFIAREAPQALADMAQAAGSTVHAMAELWMAFEPLNDNFSQWLVDATQSLDQWATGLSKTQGFQDFVAYIRDTGPQVAETFGAIANAVLQIVEAASPLGGPVLAGVEAFAKAVAAIADSDIGTPLFTAAAALALFNRTLSITTSARGGITGFGSRMTGAAAQAKGFGLSLQAVRGDLTLLGTTALTAGARTEREMMRVNAATGRLRTSLLPVGKSAALLGGLGIAATGAADGLGLTNTASLALAGSIAGPWGAAVGGAAGLLLDAKDAASGFGAALANVDDIVASGNFEQLSAKLAQLRAERNDLTSTSGVGDFFGDSITKISKRGAFGSSATERVDFQIRKIGDAMNDAADAAAGSQVATDAYGRVISGTGNAAQDTADQIHAMTEAMHTQRQEALNAFSAETRYRQALKDARKQAASSNAGIKGDTEEALKNRAAITTLADAWNNQSDAVKNNVDKFHAAKAAFIETATGMGVPIEQARKLARRLLEIPESKVIGVKIEAINALNAIQRIKDRLRSLPRSITTDYYVNQVNAYNKTHGGGRDGDPSTTYADGGMVRGPGGPRDDLIPARLSDGEFVVNAAATRRNRALLEQINAQRFADGGYVTRLAGPVTGASAIDYGQLADAMSQARPLYGDVSLQPHNYNEFRREMEADRRRAATSGVR